MKTIFNCRCLSALVALGFCFMAHSQGTFIYDQQSSDESFVAGGIPIQTSQPLGQSFTPGLPAIEFIRLFVYDLAPGNSSGATLFVNLRTNSISGPILAFTGSVFMPDGFTGVTNFLFSTPVSLTAGATYFFQPVVQSGDGWGTAAYNAYNYSGGTEIFQGSVFPSNDLWFREGVVPEPSSTVLLLLGVSALGMRRFGRRRSVHESKSET